LIKDEYLVNHRTILLSPGKDINYECKAIEIDGEICIKMSASKIIDQSCRHYNFAYHKSVREVIGEDFEFYRKAPVPLGTNCLFPTHRITDIDCYWVSIVHLKKVYSLDKGQRTKLVFTNGYDLELDVSLKSIRNQTKRARVIFERKQSSYYEFFINTPINYLLTERKGHYIWERG